MKNYPNLTNDFSAESAVPNPKPSNIGYSPDNVATSHLLKKVINPSFSSASLYAGQGLSYNFSSLGASTEHANRKKANKIIQNFYLRLSSLISTPFYAITPRTVIISLCFYFTEQNLKSYYAPTMPRHSTANLSTLADTENQISLQPINESKGPHSLARLEDPDYSPILRAIPTEISRFKPNFMTTVNNHHITSLFNLGTDKFLFNSIKTQKLLVVLSKLFGKNVKLQLVRLYNPFKDSKILAQLIGLNGKDYKFYKIEDMLFSRAVINKNFNRNSNLIEFTQMATILNGIKIRLAGRLITQNIVPAERLGKTLEWVKLSNSGDTLKPMVPSYSRKAISGWSNYPGTVTSHMMNENEMGYRGSKSVISLNVNLIFKILTIFAF